MSLKFQHHNVTHYSPAGNGDVNDTVVHKNVLWSKSLSLTFWTQITYQSFFTCWIILELGIFQTLLTNSQTGNGFKARPLNNFP
jgi:hypothetical protein